MMSFFFVCVTTKANIVITKDLNKAWPEVTTTKSGFVFFKSKKKKVSDPVTGPVWPRGWVEV